MTLTAAVVGAGILGRLMALRLKRAGYRVLLFDRSGPGQRTACSFAAAGLLTPVAESVDGGSSHLLSLGLRSRQLWQDLLPTLAAPVVLGTKGTLHLAHAEDLPLLEELAEKLARRAPKTVRTWLNPSQLGTMEPAFAGSDFAMALHLPADGYIESHAALAALLRSLECEGVELHWQTEVASVAPGMVHLRDAGAVACDHVFDCRGMGARHDLPFLRGVRGELVEIHAPEVNLAMPVHVMHQRYPIYVVPRGSHVYAVGATSIESGSAEPVTVKGALELLSAAYSVHPGFRFGHITALVANCRPALADNMPHLLDYPGLWWLNGLYRHGFLLAPVLVDCAMRHLAGQDLAEDERSMLSVA